MKWSFAIAFIPKYFLLFTIIWGFFSPFAPRRIQFTISYEETAHLCIEDYDLKKSRCHEFLNHVYMKVLFTLHTVLINSDYDKLCYVANDHNGPNMIKFPTSRQTLSTRPMYHMWWLLEFDFKALWETQLLPFELMVN